MKIKHFLALSALLYACHSQPQHAKQQPAETAVASQVQRKDSVICPGDMQESSTDSIPPGLFAPENREDICGWRMPEDTVTVKGNFIKYLISNDSCCLDNLYIEWGNSKYRHIETFPPLRQFHPKMTPELLAETNDCLFLEGAASGGLPVIGSLLYVFPLQGNGQVEGYEMISWEAFDPNSMTLVREVENATERHFIEAYNIRTHKTKPFRFKNRQLCASASWAVDSVSVTPQKIFVRMSLVDDKDESIIETLVLSNDIK